MSTSVTSQIAGVLQSLAIKSPVHAVATTNITLSGLQTVGGVVLDGSVLYRVLCVGQTNAVDNGIWDASTGSWSRAKDFDGPLDAVKGTLVIVQSSTNTLYRLTTANPIVPGTTSLAFELTAVNLTQADLTAIGILSTGIKYDITAAETATGVTPVNLNYEPGLRHRYASLADAVAVCASHPLYSSLTEVISAHITIPDGGKIYFVGDPLITNSTAGDHVFDATSKDGIHVWYGRFAGSNKTTVPLSGFGGYSAANTGLVTLTSCTNSHIKGCSADTFYNGFTAQNCTRTHITNSNRITNWTFAGIIGSSGQKSHFDFNNIDGGPTGAAVAYGIILTGDDAGGKPQKDCTANFNIIDGVPSWDAIMSHDCDGLTILGNTCRNVRAGIDIGHLVATNIVKNITIDDNIIISTTTDTWATASAAHAGIAVVGYDATHRVSGVSIGAGNIIRGFFATAGMTVPGNAGGIAVANADDVSIGASSVLDSGSAVSNAGVNLNGTLNRVSVGAVTLSGTMARGGIRCENVTADVLSYSGCVIKQATASDAAISFTGSTISAFQQSSVTSNSTTPFSSSTSTITYAGPSTKRMVVNQAIASLATGTARQDTYTLAGVVPGDSVTVTLPANWPAGMTVSSPIVGTGQVYLQLYNPTGGSLSMAADDFVFTVTPYR